MSTVPDTVVLDALNRCRRSMLIYVWVLTGIAIAGAAFFITMAAQECLLAAMLTGVPVAVPLLLAAVLTPRIQVRWDESGLRYRSRWRTVQLPRESITALGWFDSTGGVGQQDVYWPAFYGPEGRLTTVIPLPHTYIARELGVPKEQVVRLLERDAERLDALFKPRVPSMPSAMWGLVILGGAFCVPAGWLVLSLLVCRR